MEEESGNVQGNHHGKSLWTKRSRIKLKKKNRKEQ